MRVYLDWNATAPPLTAALDAMRDAARSAWANPASVHGHGRAARAIVESARASVAELAGCDPRDVILTSGGTEANNLALRSAFASDGAAAKGTLLVSRLEHPSITRVAEDLERRGGVTVRWIPVHADGVVDVEALASALRDAPSPVVVALQAVNHETGIVQPVDDVIALAHAAGATVHVDAVQAFGRVASGGSSADTRSLASHKLRGPKGIGALVTRAGMRVSPLLRAAEQERGVRPGTVDPIAAAGLAVAAAHARTGPSRYAAIASLRDDLERAILAAATVHGASVNGSAARAPHVTNVAFHGWNGPELVAAFDLDGLSVSSGSACSAGTLEPSPVIAAMFDASRASRSVRFSLGEDTNRDDIARAITIVRAVLARAALT
jgi:cysteine desulfurase